MRQVLWRLLLPLLMILSGAPLSAVTAVTGDHFPNGVALAVTTPAQTGNLGPTAIGSTNAFSLSMTVGPDVTLTDIQVVTLGTSGKEFTRTDSTTLGVTDTEISVSVAFAPQFPGLITGALICRGYYTSDPSTTVTLFTLPLAGTGLGPMVNFVPASGNYLQTFGGTIGLSQPVQLALDGAGNLYFADYNGSDVVKATGAILSQVDFSGVPGGLGNVGGVAVDGDGTIYASDSTNTQLVTRDIFGTVASITAPSNFQTALNNLGALATDASGNLYIADTGNNRVVRFEPFNPNADTWDEFVMGTPSATPPTIGSLAGIAVAPDGTLYLADSANHQVLKVTQPFTATAAFTNVDVGFPLGAPNGLATDRMGNLYIADRSSLFILRVTPAGAVSVLDQQSSDAPQSLAVMGSGDVLAIYASGHVGKILLSQPPSLGFADTFVGATSSDSFQSVAVTNLGTQDLTIATAYPTDFPVTSGDPNLIGSTIPAGASRDVSVNFTPQSIGALSEAVVLTDNNLNVAGTQQQIQVSGNGRAASTSIALAGDYGRAAPGSPWLVRAAATVVNTSVGNAPVTQGTVRFSITFSPANGGPPLGYLPQTVPLNGSGVAIFTLTPATPGSYAISASYIPPGPAYLASGPASTTVTLPQNVPTVTLGSSQNPAPYQTPVTFTATITPAATGYIPVPAAGPTGTVTFFDGANQLAITPVVSGTATSAPFTLAPGPHSITAQYSGDFNYALTTSSPLSQTVLAAPASATTVSLNSSPNPAVASAPVTLTAKVTATAAGAGIPSGSVTFMDGSTALATVPLDATGTATTTTTSLNAGSQFLFQTHSLTAAYNGAALFLASTSAARSQVVYKTLAKVTLVSSKSKAKAGTQVTFTATLAPTAGATATPSGSVKFYDSTIAGTTLLGTQPLGNGTATLSTSSLKVGIHAITVTYGGDANYLAGAGAAGEVITN
jgi:sugar lactone lactonase YvrE